jgi:hypothetical protein
MRSNKSTLQNHNSKRSLMEFQEPKESELLLLLLLQQIILKIEKL